MTNQKTPAEPIQELEKVLKEQLSLYAQYTQQLAGDSTLMAKLQIEELEKSNKIKNTLLLKVQAIDEARSACVKKIASQYGIKSEKIKIEEICHALGTHPANTRLSSIRSQLQESIHNLRRVQEETKLLAQNSLSWMNGSMNRLKSLLSPTNTYNPQGKVDHPQMFAGRMLEKEV